MRRKLLAALLALAVALPFGVYVASADQPEVPAKPERGKPVRPGVALWVFVFPEGPQRGKPPSEPDTKCTDGDQGAYDLFAKAKSDGMTFSINAGSIPTYLDAGQTSGAIGSSFAAWDNVTELNYFTVNNSGGAARPAEDGNNTVGWAFIVPKTVLAAAWVWVDTTTNRVLEADIFFNNQHKWGVFTTCNAQDRYEVGDVGTHEVGHVVALDHISDQYKHATMYPSAPKGEVKKRTLTPGDSAGFVVALSP